jgi:hypothetical protein
LEVEVVKKLITIIAVVVALAGGQAWALYFVDIGTPASEAAYYPEGWGPIQPDTSGGNWGGIASDPLSPDKKARVMWEATDDPSASLTFPTSITAMAVRHLKGLADDSFDVEVGVASWGSAVDNVSDSEVWAISSFMGTPGKKLTLTATGEAWSGFDTYGQVAIDWVVATQPGETFQVWTFDDDENPEVPEINLNPYGAATAGFTAAAPPEWISTLLGREGVWQTEGVLELNIEIPNQMVRNPYKEICIEIGFLGDLLDFSVLPIPVGGIVQETSRSIVDTGTGWKKLTASYYIEPNPDRELLCYVLSGDIAAVDYVAAYTVCVPEPLTISLLGFGGLMVWRRRRAA